MKWRTIGIVAALAAAGAGAALWLGARPADRGRHGRGRTRAGRRDGDQHPRRHGRGLPARQARAADRRPDREPAGEEGRSREADQVLLELWNDDIRAELTVAERDAAVAGARREEACVAARVARREAGRLASLLERKLVSAELAERAAGRSRGARGGLPRGRRADRVSQARIDAARAPLDRTLLRAPFAGVGRGDQRRTRRVRHAVAGRHPDAAGGGRRRHELPLRHRADRRSRRAARARGHAGARHARRLPRQQLPGARAPRRAVRARRREAGAHRRGRGRVRRRRRRAAAGRLQRRRRGDPRRACRRAARPDPRAARGQARATCLEGRPSSGRARSTTGLSNWEFTEITAGSRPATGS